MHLESNPRKSSLGMDWSFWLRFLRASSFIKQHSQNRSIHFGSSYFSSNTLVKSIDYAIIFVIFIQNDYDFTSACLFLKPYAQISPVITENYMNSVPVNAFQPNSSTVSPYYYPSGPKY